MKKSDQFEKRKVSADHAENGLYGYAVTANLNGEHIAIVGATRQGAAAAFSRLFGVQADLAGVQEVIMLPGWSAD